MMEKEKLENKKFRYKWFIAFIILAVLLVSARLALKSDWLFEKIRGIAIEQVNTQINGNLSIASVRGDLLNGFVMSELSLKDIEGENIATIDSIQISYNILDFIRFPHEVEKLSVWGVQAYIKQNQESEWNVLSLIDMEDPDDPESEFYWDVNSIYLFDVNVFAESEELFPDGFLNVVNLNSELSAGVREDGFYGGIQSLEFDIEEARLPESVAVYIAADAVGGKYTLESLIINTGRTALNASAYFSDEQLSAESTITPLSWRDVLAYAEDLPLQQNLNIQLSAEGRLSRAKLTILANADGLTSFSTTLEADLTSSITLHSLTIQAEGFEGRKLLGLDEALSFGQFTFEGSGYIQLETPELSDWEGKLSISEFLATGYEFDQFNSDYAVNSGEFKFDSEMRYNGEQINTSIIASDIWGEIPAWQVELNANQINLATWTKDPALDSQLNINSITEGEGFNIDDLTVSSSINISDGRFGDQSFSQVTFNGNLNSSSIYGLLTAKLVESELLADFMLNNWQEETPDYEFELELNKFNSAELVGLEDLSIYLNGKLTGDGVSFDPESLKLYAEASFDSSFVNGEEIQTLRASLSLQNAILTVDEALLESPIIDASFSAQQHIFEMNNPQNRLDFFASIKDLQPLSELFGFEVLQSQGNIEGGLSIGDSGFLQFKSRLELEDTVIDSLFLSEKITGNLTAYLYEEPEVDVEVDVLKPTISGVTVQDITVKTHATIGELDQFGKVGFKVVNDEKSSVRHEGEFRISPDRVLLNTNQLDVTTDLRTLSLVNSFDTTIENGVLRMDTLSVQSSEENALLRLWIPHLDSLKQQVGLQAQDLNLGAIQSIVIEEPILEGLLTGRIELDNDPEYLIVNASGILSDFQYESGSLDSFEFEISLTDEWLEGSVNAVHEDVNLFAGSLKVPFLPGDPLTFDSEFFDREIDGSFKLIETDISYWLSFLPDNNIQDTEGIISLDTQLRGLAGSPEFDGKLTIKEALLSGISVDSLGFDMLYVHETEEVEFEGYVVSLKRPIIDFDARVPFKVDLRQAEILLPSDEDSVNVNLRTEDFDLALFNDFVDRDVIRQLSGNLNGNVSLNGRIADLQPTGMMELSNGTLRVVQAGITLSEIRATINFEPDRIQIQEYSMSSGPGRIRASGFIEIENLVPGNIELDIRGNQFRAANTSDYNATVDLSADLRGTFLEPRVSGNLTFLNGFVNLQNFGERAIEDVQLDDEEEPEPIDFYDAMAIEMNVQFTRQFYIRNRQFLDMEIELGGDVDLLKESYGELQMFGSVEGIRGYARPLGKNFVLDEALISFFGPIDNPELNVRTRFEPPQAQSDVRIFYVIDGTVQSPEFRFESEPQLELQDIISYTLFGKPFYELESWEQVVAGSGGGPSATDFALDILLDRVEMIASQRLGIDVVQIDNSRSGSNSTTSITTGWYLNRRTFFAILNEISSTRPKTLFLIEYMLTDNLELILLQGDDSREGIDLRWKFDY